MRGRGDREGRIQVRRNQIKNSPRFAVAASRLPRLGREFMNPAMKTFRSISFSVMVAGSAAVAPETLFAQVVCSGHEALSTPRPEASCLNIPPEFFELPDKKLRAVVFPVDISLDTTPDMESRVVIRSSDGNTVTSKDYSSPRGMNGYYVYRGQWSPRLAVLRLQPDVIGRPFAVVVPDDGVQPAKECHRKIQRHDQWQSDGVGRVFVRRTSYALRRHLEEARGAG